MSANEQTKIQEHKKYGIGAFVPLIVFLCLYLGSGIYYSAIGAENPWKQISRSAALFVGISVAFIMNRQMKFKEKVKVFCKTAGESGTIMMVMIFLVAGAFTGVCKAIGSVDSVVNMALTVLPPHFILPGMFIVSSFLSFATGSFTSAVLSLGPIAIAVALGSGGSVPLFVGAVFSGGLFGDNLSMISDTTIAATSGSGCEMKDKFKMNLLIAIPAAIASIILFTVLGISTSKPVSEDLPFSVLKIIPYIYIFVSACLGMDVFLVMASGIVVTGVIGLATSSISLQGIIQGITNGMSGAMELCVLAILIRGLIGIIVSYGGIEWLMSALRRKVNSRKGAEYCIAFMTALISFSLANNTIAIMVTSPMANEIAKENHIVPKRVASLLDIFACCFLGLAPHTAGYLIMQSYAPDASPLAMAGCCFYCIFLCISAIVTIQFGLLRTPEEKAYMKELKEAAKNN